MNDNLSDIMFWVGGMMAVVPLLFGGVLVGVWWFQRKKRQSPSSGGRAALGDGERQS